MKRVWPALLLASICAGCSAAPAAAPAPAPAPAPPPVAAAPAARGPATGMGDQDFAAAADMATLYQRLCLLAFPDDAAAEAELRQMGASPLSPAQVAAMLHSDQGHGWLLATPTARYQVTLEAPPFHTCAIRRMTRFGLPTAQPYVEVMRDYAARHGLVPGQARVIRSQTSGGADVQLIGTPLLTPGSTVPGETSLYVSTNYHGRFNPAAVPEAAGGVGVEIRMAHQVTLPKATRGTRT